MFDMKAMAEIRHLNVRKQTHGDQFVPADDIKLMLMAVPVDNLTSACPEMGERFYEGDQVAVGEVSPLTVWHALENMYVYIGEEAKDEGVGLEGVAIKKGMKVHLLPNKLANVELSIQATDVNDDDYARLRHLFMDGKAMVRMQERQLDLVELEQGTG